MACTYWCIQTCLYWIPIIVGVAINLFLDTNVSILDPNKNKKGIGLGRYSVATAVRYHKLHVMSTFVMSEHLNGAHCMCTRQIFDIDACASLHAQCHVHDIVHISINCAQRGLQAWEQALVRALGGCFPGMHVHQTAKPWNFNPPHGSTVNWLTTDQVLLVVMSTVTTAKCA